MNKILLGFIGIGFFTFFGCKNDKVDINTYSSSLKDIVKNSSVTDVDGNNYTSVKIGDQEWMVENLRTTKYSDGTAIPNVTDSAKWMGFKKGAWSHYDNDSKYESTYGKLYNRYAVETGKLAPKGWHIPTDAEWSVLTDYLSVNGYSGKEGIALKSVSEWKNDNEDQSVKGLKDYGWLGFPGGSRYSNGNFYDIGKYGSWWSFSEDSTNVAWNRYLLSSNSSIFKANGFKEDGFSVRCLKD